jgi:hypothetical protein
MQKSRWRKSPKEFVSCELLSEFTVAVDGRSKEALSVSVRHFHINQIPLRSGLMVFNLTEMISIRLCIVANGEHQTFWV